MSGDGRGLAVVIDGRAFYDNHPDAWRFGVVLPKEHPALVAVWCEPRGKERKARKIMCSPTWLLADTPTLRARLTELGLTKQ